MSSDIAKSIDRRVPHDIVTGGLARLNQALEDALSALTRRQTPEVVHEARIAVRRLQAALRNLKEQLPPHERKACMVALSAIVKECSAVRDADVRCRLVRHWLTRTGLKDHEQARLLRETADRNRTEARRDLRLQIRAPKWDKRLWTLRQNQLALVRSQGPDFPAALVDSVRRRCARSLRDLPKATRKRRELNRLRLRIKDARYFLEDFGPLLGGPRGDEITQLRGVQTMLGDLHDGWQLGQWLRAQYKCYLVTDAMLIELKEHKRRLLKRIRHVPDQVRS